MFYGRNTFSAELDFRYDPQYKIMVPLNDGGNLWFHSLGEQKLRSVKTLNIYHGVEVHFRGRASYTDFDLPELDAPLIDEVAPIYERFAAAPGLHLVHRRRISTDEARKPLVDWAVIAVPIGASAQDEDHGVVVDES